MSVTTEATAIHPFHLDIPDEAVDDLRGRIEATRWPSRELVDDRSQGVQLATLQALARHWTTDYDWRACEARLNALPQFTTEIDGVDIHFIHVQLAARGRHAARHDARLARLGRRAARDRGPAHRPDRARRRGRGCLPPGAALAARLRLLRRAGGGRLARGPYRGRLGGADEPARLYPLRRPGRRRGRRRDRRDEPAGAQRAPRRPHQPARGRARHHGQTAGGDRAGARGARRGRRIQGDRLRLLPRAVHAAADDRVRPAGFTRGHGGLDARPRHRQLLQGLSAPSSTTSPRAISPETT